MKRGLKIFIRILETIIALPLAIAGAVCLIPFTILGLLIAVPTAIVEDIWGLLPHEEDIRGY